MITRLLRSILLLFVLCTANAFSNIQSRPVIIDTDIGFDDLLAITYLLQQPTIDVKAITIAATGETPCNPGYVNLKRMLKKLGKANIPVHCGRATPLRGKHQFPSEWSPFQTNVDSRLMQTKINARTAITHLLSDAKQSYDIIALGPLTNIGEVMQKSPQLAHKIHRLYIMGGAVHVAGNLRIANKNLNHTAEWNIYIDPYAASLVFKSQLPITLIPLDVTNTVRLPPHFYSQLKYSRTKPAITLLQLFHSLPTVVSKAMETTDWYAWDSLAAVIAIHPQYALIKAEKLNVIIKPDHDSGTLYLDQKQGKTVNVCYALDKPKFMASLNSALTRGNRVKSGQ